MPDGKGEDCPKNGQEAPSLPDFGKTNTGEKRQRGGQPGNRNALKHGLHTAPSRAEFRALLANARKLIFDGETIAMARDQAYGRKRGRWPS